MKSRMEATIAELEQQNAFAIGNDLVFIHGFEKSFNNLFREKVYTSAEIAYCSQFSDPLLRYASTWAAKEAVYKAVKQINDKPLSFKNIEISRAKIAGKPLVILPADLSHLNISLSITHDGAYVWAVAIIENNKS
jgi:holo-[acyl-carrier protein] synthase